MRAKSVAMYSLRRDVKVAFADDFLFSPSSKLAIFPSTVSSSIVHAIMNRMSNPPIFLLLLTT